jgi:hypothetical protein
VNGLRAIGIDYDIQAIDITDPNPVSLLLLCVHLYNHLPHYLPKTTVNFEGSLHAPVIRHVSDSLIIQDHAFKRYLLWVGFYLYNLLCVLCFSMKRSVV